MDKFDNLVGEVTTTKEKLKGLGVIVMAIIVIFISIMIMWYALANPQKTQTELFLDIPKAVTGQWE